MSGTPRKFRVTNRLSALDIEQCPPHIYLKMRTYKMKRNVARKYVATLACLGKAYVGKNLRDMIQARCPIGLRKTEITQSVIRKHLDHLTVWRVDKRILGIESLSAIMGNIDIHGTILINVSTAKTPIANLTILSCICKHKKIRSLKDRIISRETFAD